MPWFIQQQDKQYCVFKEGAAEALHCFDTERAAQAYLRALYASEGKGLTLKDGVIGGYAVAFTGPEDKDLQGEYFTPDTDLWLTHYPAVPVLYNHGQDPQMGARVIGIAHPVRKDEHGVWYEAQLTERDAYEQAVLRLVRDGVLGYSTGSLPHLVQRASDGKLESWPIAELTLTPTPAAGPYLTTVQAVRSHYKSIQSFGGKTMNLLDTIKKLVPGLSDEQYAQLEAVLALAGMTSSTPDPADVLDEMKAVTPSITEAQVKALIAAALPDETPAILTEAQIKSLIDRTLAPYLQPESKSAPAQAPEDKRRAAVKAFDVYLHSGAGRQAVKALEEGTPGEGGYLVPEQYYAELVAGLTDQSIIRAAGARVVAMTSDTMEVPTLTHQAAAVLTDEEAPYDETDPSFGHVTFTPYKATRLVKVSEELAADAAFDIWGQVLAPDFTQAFAAFENSYFTTGNGTTAPQGVITGAGVGVTSAAPTAIDPDEIIDLYHSLGYLYRQNAIWMMNDATIKYIRKLIDGTGQYLWQPGMAEGQPDRLLGRPVITNNSMATIAATAKTILFADFRYYWIGQRAQMTVDRNPYLYMANGQVGFFARMRLDGHVMLAEAFKVLQMHA